LFGIKSKQRTSVMSDLILSSPEGAAVKTNGGVTQPSQTGWMLLGLGLATWMEFYTYDAVNLALPDMADSFGVSQDQASWFLTTYSSALLLGVSRFNLDGGVRRAVPVENQIRTYS
jgi:hypothetical protein